MKDNFSTASDKYAKFRPTYPSEFFNFLLELIRDKNTAWDCGTGNGQVASVLSEHFKAVFATDISAKQLEQAPVKDNVNYSIQSAENTTFSNQYFDLITVAQAIHWFDFEQFYAEVKRTLKPNGIIAVAGYGLIRVSPEIDQHIDNFYQNVVGPFWDNERKYLDEEYNTIPFPFLEIKAPSFKIQQKWDLNHFINYLKTWSAVKHCQTLKGFNPVDGLKTPLEMLWKNGEVKEITFPMFTRIGKLVV